MDRLDLYRTHEIVDIFKRYLNRSKRFLATFSKNRFPVFSEAFVDILRAVFAVENTVDTRIVSFYYCSVDDTRLRLYGHGIILAVPDGDVASSVGRRNTCEKLNFITTSRRHPATGTVQN